MFARYDPTVAHQLPSPSESRYFAQFGRDCHRRYSSHSPQGLQSLDHQRASSPVPTSLLLRSSDPAARCAVPRAPPHSGNLARWLLAPSARSALRVLPRRGSSRSRASHLSAAAGHAVRETCPADVWPVTGLSLPPPELAPDLARPHGLHPAPTPASTPRPDNSAPASAHRADRSSLALPISPAPALAPPLRTSLPVPSVASTPHTRWDPLHNRTAAAPLVPVS